MLVTLTLKFLSSRKLQQQKEVRGSGFEIRGLCHWQLSCPFPSAQTINLKLQTLKDANSAAEIVHRYKRNSGFQSSLQLCI